MPASDKIRYTIMVWNRLSAPKLYGVFDTAENAAKVAVRWQTKIHKTADWVTVDVVAIRPATATHRKTHWGV